MARKFIHSVLVQNETIAAATVVSYNLPVNPLSFIALTTRFAQNQANTQLTFANIAAMISKVEVLYKGQAILSMNGLDLMALNMFLLGFVPAPYNENGNDNDLRAFTYILPMGRKLYRADECFVKTSSGELVLQVTYAASFTQIDGASLQVETVEIPDANPTRYLKVTTLTGTPAATGQFDTELPKGNLLAALLLFGTTIPAAAVSTVTIGDVQIRKNNSEEVYGKSNFETLRMMGGLWTKNTGMRSAHIHQYDAAAYAQYGDVSAVKAVSDEIPNHLWLPFDVTGDLEYALDTKDATSLCLRVTAGDTNALRILPIESVALR